MTEKSAKKWDLGPRPSRTSGRPPTRGNIYFFASKTGNKACTPQYLSDFYGSWALQDRNFELNPTVPLPLGMAQNRKKYSHSLVSIPDVTSITWALRFRSWSYTSLVSWRSVWDHRAVQITAIHLSVWLACIASRMPAWCRHDASMMPAWPTFTELLPSLAEVSVIKARHISATEAASWRAHTAAYCDTRLYCDNLQMMV